MNTTTPKTLMTTEDLDSLRVLAQEARRDMLTPAGVRCLGDGAVVAADTIAALQEQNREALRRVESLEDTLEGYRELGVSDPAAAADALSVVRHIAEALGVPADDDGAIQEALEALIAKADERNLLVSVAEELKAKAQQWDAATVAGALGTMDLVRVYYRAAGLPAPATDNPENYEPRTAAILAVAAHVRAHDGHLLGNLERDLASYEALAVGRGKPGESAFQTVRRLCEGELAKVPVAGDGPPRVGDTVECLDDEGDHGIVTEVNGEDVWARWPNGATVDFPASLLRVVKRAPTPPQPAASEPSDAIAEWLAHCKNGAVTGIYQGDEPAGVDCVRRLARAFTALVGRVEQGERMRHETGVRLAERLSKLERGEVST